VSETILKNVYKAMRGDRTALRTLVERYRGVAYALAYRETKSFPRAQRVALRAWVRLAERLPQLSEPERFLELVAEAVRAVAPDTPVQPDRASVESAHSILKTEKVQARRALRKALADCPRPEANAFFLRFVEGLSTDEIAELYGVEPPVAVEAQAAVCLDLAHRAGLAGSSEKPPTLEELPPERREALLLCVRHSETNLDDESAKRLSDLVQGDPDIRREVEASRTVLSLSPATFAAHRLHTEFVREAMQGIPLIEPRTTPTPRPPRPAQAEKDTHTSAIAALFALGLILGLLLPALLLESLEPLFENWGTTPYLMGVAAFVLPLGLLALGLARPPLTPSQKWPSGYYLVYAALLASVLTLLFYQVAGSDAELLALWHCVAPMWSVLSLGLVGVRWQLDLQTLETRLDARFRRLEAAVQVGPDVRTPTPPTPAASPSTGPSQAS